VKLGNKLYSSFHTGVIQWRKAGGIISHIQAPYIRGKLKNNMSYAGAVHWRKAGGITCHIQVPDIGRKLGENNISLYSAHMLEERCRKNISLYRRHTLEES
jgi:hypothetical protein